mmetsp:Transcript_17737/g.42729  ORF Transcript_17737/g.42729 Transcript_17737/m.42729 type:complete len:236 (+) Transcript_17737:1179-1886(+)
MLESKASLRRVASLSRIRAAPLSFLSSTTTNTRFSAAVNGADGASISSSPLMESANTLLLAASTLPNNLLGPPPVLSPPDSMTTSPSPTSPQLPQSTPRPMLPASLSAAAAFFVLSLKSLSLFKKSFVSKSILSIKFCFSSCTFSAAAVSILPLLSARSSWSWLRRSSMSARRESTAASSVACAASRMSAISSGVREGSWEPMSMPSFFPMRESSPSDSSSSSSSLLSSFPRASS